MLFPIALLPQGYSPVSPPSPAVPGINGNPFGELIKAPTPSMPQPGGGYLPSGYKSPISQPTNAAQVRQQAMAEMEADLERIYARKRAYAMPSCMGAPGTQYYREAYSEIKAMLEGQSPLDLGRAVFLVENAYMGDSMDYTEFNGSMNLVASFLKEKVKEEGNAVENNTAKIMMLHRFFTDTMKVWDKGFEDYVWHYPYTYDFEDFEGRKNWRKQFVTKLLASGSGQCHSLPLLYLILAQKMGTEAFLTFSPNHSYIRFEDAGRWYNLELTNGRLTADSWVMGSGFIKAEAVQHGLYMDTLSLKGAVASSLVDLASGYGRLHCMDAFVLQTLNTALQYQYENPVGLGMKSDYYTMWFAHAIRVSGNPPPSELYRYPEAVDLYQKRNEMYALLDEMGYQTMSDEVYQEWLQSVNDEKQKQEHDQQMIRIEKSAEFKE